MESMAELLKKMGKSPEEEPHKSEEERKLEQKKYTEEKCRYFNESEGELHKKDGYDCKLCKNKGGIMSYEEVNGHFNETYRPCKCMRIRGMIAKMERSGLKNIMKDYTFEKYQATEPWQERLKETAMKFIADEQNTWFFIGGMSGTGKTHLCTAIAAHYLRKNKAVKYMLWRDEITKIKSIVNDSQKYSEAIDELKRAEVLYIDDLFKMGKDANGEVQRPTTADVNVAFEILNYRYNNKELITIISSERTIQAIIDIDEAIGGRISEMTVPTGYYIGIKYDPNKNYRTKGIIEL